MLGKGKPTIAARLSFGLLLIRTGSGTLAAAAAAVLVQETGEL